MEASHYLCHHRDIDRHHVCAMGRMSDNGSCRGLALVADNCYW